MKKRIVMYIAIPMMATSLHGATLEEARKVVHEYTELHKQHRTSMENGEFMKLDESDRVAFYRKQDEARDAFYALGYDAFPALYAMLREEPSSDDCIWRAIEGFVVLDECNLASEGEQEALEWARKIFAANTPSARGGVRGPHFFLTSGCLANKSKDAGDIELLRQGGASSYDGVALLEARIAGNNIFALPAEHTDEDVLRIPLICPSATNTGSQAVYVHAVLMKFWEQKGSVEERSWDWLTEIPEELVKMVVSFNADGEPICNVDLTRYGLSMPIITPKPDKHYRGKYTMTFPHETVGRDDPPPQATNVISDIEAEAELSTDTMQDDTPFPEQPQTSPKSNYLLWFSVDILAILLISFLAWWKQGQKNL